MDGDGDHEVDEDGPQPGNELHPPASRARKTKSPATGGGTGSRSRASRTPTRGGGAAKAAARPRTRKPSKT